MTENELVRQLEHEFARQCKLFKGNISDDAMIRRILGKHLGYDLTPKAALMASIALVNNGLSISRASRYCLIFFLFVSL